MTRASRPIRGSHRVEQWWKLDSPSLFTAYDVHRYWRTIVAIGLIGVLVALGATMLTPERFRATLVFFASSSAESNNTELQADEFARRRLPSYPLLVQSDLVIDGVLADSDLQMSPTELKAALRAQVEPDTVLLRVTVTESSPVQLRAIAESVTKVLPKVVSEIDFNDKKSQGNITLKLISGPSVSPGPVSPNTRLNLAIGGLLGLGIGLAQAVFRTRVRRTSHHQR